VPLPFGGKLIELANLSLILAVFALASALVITAVETP
jgi:hypothetical protein